MPRIKYRSVGLQIDVKGQLDHELRALAVDAGRKLLISDLVGASLRVSLRHRRELLAELAPDLPEPPTEGA